jgi:hypothetical protein
MTLHQEQELNAAGFETVSSAVTPFITTAITETRTIMADERIRSYVTLQYDTPADLIHARIDCKEYLQAEITRSEGIFGLLFMRQDGSLFGALPEGKFFLDDPGDNPLPRDIREQIMDAPRGQTVWAGPISGAVLYGFETPDILAAVLSSPSGVPQGREMIANVADLHPQYNEGVHVREASPYDQSIFTRFRYVLLAVGKELSWEQEMKAKIEAEYYRSKMEYNLGVEQGYAEAYDSFTTEAYNGFVEVDNAMAQEYGEIYNQGLEMGLGPDWMQGTPEVPSSSDPLEAYADSINQQFNEDVESAASQLAQMLMGGN